MRYGGLARLGRSGRTKIGDGPAGRQSDEPDYIFRSDQEPQGSCSQKRTDLPTLERKTWRTPTTERITLNDLGKTCPFHHKYLNWGHARLQHGVELVIVTQLPEHFLMQVRGDRFLTAVQPYKMTYEG